MPFPASSENDLILALQDAANGGSDWEPFLARVARLTGARFAALIMRSPGLPAPARIATAVPSGAPGPADPQDLGVVLNSRMRPERIYATAELRELIAADADGALDPALTRLGVAAVQAITAALPAAAFTLGIFGASEFVAADGAVLRRLFPFLQHAARTTVRLGHERTHATTMAGLAARTCAGWLLLDPAGLIVDSWLPGPVPGLRQRAGQHGGRIQLASQAVDADLAALVADLAADPGRPARALWLSLDPLFYLRLAPLAAGARAGPGQPALLATLHGMLHPVTDIAALLVDLLGLLPSEARLAAALAGGATLAEAAARLGLTLETARHYSKKIFAKTGLRGQTDLVRVIHECGLAELARAPVAA